MTNTYDIIIVAVVAACTIIIRAFPFAVFGRRENTSPAVDYIGKVLPSAVIAVLIIYCLKNVSFEDSELFLPQFISIAVVILLHIWKRNNLISIGFGTLCYMFLIRIM